MGEIYSWVRNIVIYLILNTIIMNLLGNSSYKKYVSIVSGMIMLLIVVSPLLKLMHVDDIIDYYLNVNIYQSDVSDFQNELRLMEDKQKDVVIACLKDRIKEQVADILLNYNLYLYDFNVVINQDDNSESNNIRKNINSKSSSNCFGEIESISIVAGYLEDAKIPVFKVDIGKIEISDILKDNNEESYIKYGENSTLKPPLPEEIHIKKRLSDFYNVEQDNINISIKGE